MSLFSWFNSADQVDTALVVVAIIGAIIEAGVAVAAVINVHKELEESRKEKLEKYIEVFACVAAFFFLAEAILGCRSSMLLGIELEKLKTANLVLQKELQPRTITKAQYDDFIRLSVGIPHFPVKIVVGMCDGETLNYAHHIRGMLDDAGFKSDAGDSKDGFVQLPYLYPLRPMGDIDNSANLIVILNDTNMSFESGKQTISFVIPGVSNANFSVSNVNYYMTNNPHASTVVVMNINGVFSKIGINATWATKNWSGLGQGEAAFFVPEKFY